jgi:hypothetical protein
MLLPDKRATLAGAWVHARVGHDGIDPAEAHAVAHLRADDSRSLGATARDALQAPAVRIVAQQLLNGRLQFGDLGVQMEHLAHTGAHHEAARGHGPRTGRRASRRLLQQGNLCLTPPPVARRFGDAQHGVLGGLGERRRAGLGRQHVPSGRHAPIRIAG